MFCGKCGIELREGSKFCGNCGWSPESQERPNQSTQQRQGPHTNAQGSQFQATGPYCYGEMKRPKKNAGRIILIVVGILAALFILFIAIAMLPSGSEAGAVVKNGHFHSYPSETVGDAFADFFSDPKWEDFTGTNGNTYVQFTGGCVFYNEIVDIKFVFLVNKEANTFEIELARLDGQLCSLSDIEEILAVVYAE